jgi:hypothetical protein
MSIGSGSGMAVGSGIGVGSGAGVGVAAGAQAASTRAVTVNSMAKTLKRFIFFTPYFCFFLSDFCTYFVQIMYVFYSFCPDCQEEKSALNKLLSCPFPP